MTVSFPIFSAIPKLMLHRVSQMALLGVSLREESSFVR